MRGEMLSNRYKIIDVVGTGGMAIVYKATDTLLNRTVAIKVLKEEYNSNEQFIKKFRRESQAAASLSHNNIVSIFDVGAHEGIHYIVMEYVKGDTLKSVIRKKGKIPWKETIYIAKQIALALEQAHKNEIIHRDIKPHNILINEDLIPKVADFGIARAVNSSTITLVEETMGSVHYISPEQARGGFVDERSDLYSLGVVMYEMLTGRVPFDGENSVSVAIRHIQDEIEFTVDDLDDIPQGLEDIVLKLIQKKPDERYQSARELIQDLIKVQSDEKAKIAAPIGAKTKSKESIIPEKKTKPQDKEAQKIDPKTKYIAIGIIAVVALVGLYYIVSALTAPKMVNVPEVEGLSYDEAVEVIEDNGLTFEMGESENSSTVPEDHVIRQTPQAGEEVEEGTVVTLVISDGVGEAEVPEVVGMYEVEGVKELENNNFTIKEILRDFHMEYEKDRIYDQNPSAGTLLKEGSEITLYVSKGRDTVVMEDLRGMTVEEARNRIQELGLQVGEITEQVSEDYEEGRIVSHSPKDSEEVDKNSVVTLTVSKGQLVEKTFSIDISQYQDPEEPVEVNIAVYMIDQDSNKNKIYEGSHYTTEVIDVTVEGIGVQYYQVEIDGRSYEPSILTF
ncbi:MAG TPA: Stk1 family PASTA domain-containing Ser/Thr kinase [Eubacteriaceae bacterium]|nr:Stk1 family PASTA domain-containing Ser/Thr kinase [Eubacteriaceae bacterium]